MSEIKIIAKDIETFKKIEDELNKLPEVVREQIESAEFGLAGLHCIIRNKFLENPTLRFPSSTRQISDFGDYTGVYCDDYFFKITGELYKKKIGYIILKEDKVK